MQKQKNSNLDNLSIVIGASRVKNIKVRTAYLAFLSEYIKYIAEKKDRTCLSIQICFRKSPSNAFSKVY